MSAFPDSASVFRHGDLQRLAEVAVDPLAILDESFEFVWCNAAMRTALNGEGASNVVGGLLDYVHPGDIADAEAALEAATRGAEITKVVLRIRQDSVYRDWECSIAADRERLHMSCRDVTAWNDQQRKLTSQVELLHLAEEYASLGHWRVDLVNNQLFWSEITYQIHGRSPDSFQPEVATAIECYHPEDRAMVQEAMDNSLRNHEPFQFTGRVVLPSGRFVHVFAHGEVELSDDGEPIAIFGIFQDISDRVREARQRERDERLLSLGTFAAGIAHEVNNPLAFISANVDYIRAMLEKFEGGKVDPAELVDVMEACDEVLDGTKRVASIIAGIQSFSTTNSDVPSEFQAVHAVADALDVVVDSGVEIEFPEPPPMSAVLGDETMVVRVLRELLQNAMKAIAKSDRAGIIRIGVEQVRDHIRFSIWDNGVGVSSEAMQRVFDPFFTLGDVDEGKGLGLSTCLGIVNSLGGTIDFRSEQNQWSEVVVSLRAVEPLEVREIDPIDSADAPKSSARKVIVVIDDEELVGRAIRRVLGRDHVVQYYSNAADALDVLRDGDKPDAIVSDVMMPGMSGIDFFEAVQREFEPLSRRIVFLTGGLFSPETSKFIASTNAPRITKPFEPEALRDTIEGIFEKTNG